MIFSIILAKGIENWQYNFPICHLRTHYLIVSYAPEYYILCSIVCDTAASAMYALQRKY